MLLLESLFITCHVPCSSSLCSPHKTAGIDHIQDHHRVTCVKGTQPLPLLLGDLVKKPRPLVPRTEGTPCPLLPTSYPQARPYQGDRRLHREVLHTQQAGAGSNMLFPPIHPSTQPQPQPSPDQLVRMSVCLTPHCSRLPRTTQSPLLHRCGRTHQSASLLCGQGHRSQ